MDTYSVLFSPLEPIAVKLLPSKHVEEVPTSSTPPSSTESLEEKLLDQLHSFDDLMFGSPLFDLHSHDEVNYSPWNPHVLSDYPETPSPQSSLYSTQTCSPWETCPGLAPLTAEPAFEGLLINDLTNDCSFLTLDQSLTTSFGSIVPTSPMNTTLLSPIDLGTSFAEEDRPWERIALSDDLSNFLGATEDNVTYPTDDVPLPSDDDEIPEIQNVQFTPPLLSDDIDNITTPPSPSSRPSLSSRSSYADSFAHCDSDSATTLETDSEFNNTRRRVAKINYAEFDYDRDSDDDYSDSTDSSPRKKARKSPSSHSDDGSRESSRQTPVGGRKPKGSSSSKGKKSKRRHWCPLDGCQTSFTRPTDLERHVASVHAPNRDEINKCTYCKKSFSREDAVLRHENDSCPARPKKTDVWK
ncbi:hypothetical protein BD410DRAFT_206090 [Rickenella mellea]|uniref:C2H2-type domain-containing protein n=1 Tax=Rickenella mellea TaxID=50990 RepID=A0A4Y7Q6K8_9AGAM|nr:hypothetical protein BD410DRAFT_206090 [Rickenella mellea]